MWILGVCLLVIVIVWSISAVSTQKHNSDTLIKKHNISPSMLLMDCLGFDLDNQIAIFANWHSTWRQTEKIEGVIYYAERKDTGLSIDVPISDIKDFEIEDTSVAVSKKDKRLIVHFKNVRAYPGMEFSDRAWILIPSKEVENATRLIESIGIKVQKR